MDLLNEIHVNFFAVLIAAIAYFLLGGLWYSPKVFGKHWMQHEGIHPEQIEMKPGAYVGEFIIDLVMAYVLAFVIAMSHIAHWSEAIFVSLWVWIGFVATTHLSGVIWARKSFKSFVINAGFVLVGLIVMGAIIGFFHRS